MIALSIESSNSRGMGHLFRSFLLIEYFLEHNLEFVYLINNDQISTRILEEKKIPYTIVDYSDEETKWEHQIIDQYNISIWINDKFETSEKMAQIIKERNVFLTLIDDIGLGERYADAHFVGLIALSKENFFSQNTFVGMEYVILNKEIELYKKKRKTLDKIIVSFGGSDPYGNTLKVVRNLINTNLKFDITIGPNSRYEKELNEINNGRYKIYKNVPSLMELFSHYDLAITGGGVTCCEANAMGLPCIIVANAMHEINTGKRLEAYGGSIYAGSYVSWNQNIINHIEELDIEKMSECGMNIFKTDAVERIFNKINMIISC